MESSSFCRLCSANILAECVNIFDDEGKQAKVSEIILQHFGIEIPPNDGYSTSICPSCWGITESFHRLYEMVQLAEANLATYEVTESPTEMDEMDHHYTEHEHIEQHEDFKPDDDLEHQHNDQLLQHDDQLVQHDEQLLQHDEQQLVQHDDLQFELPLHEDVKTELPIFSQVIDFKVEVKEEDELCDDDSDSDFTDGSPSSAKGATRVRVPKTEEEIQQRKQQIDLENQQIRDFFKMNCEICELTFHTMNEATLHYRRLHKQAGFLMCCGKKFFRRCLALDHIRQHINPGALQCEKCGKSYKSKFALSTHMLEHDPVPVKPFSCGVCMVTFAKQFQLSQHMRLRHMATDKKTFGCDICGKFFVTKHVLSTHIRGVHENAFAHMCHICAKTFKSKQVFDLHQREHLDHEIPKLQCNICGAWLKHEHSLRKHMSRHADTEEVCKLCNKVAPNKHALGNHMRYVHSERSYKCTMCEKAFKKPIGLKEHMASHTGVDLYTCPYCPRTFKSGANMHSHRKKKHLEQWTQDRHTRFNSNLLYPAP